MLRGGDARVDVDGGEVHHGVQGFPHGLLVVLKQLICACVWKVCAWCACVGGYACSVMIHIDGGEVHCGIQGFSQSVFVVEKQLICACVARSVRVVCVCGRVCVQ